MASILELQNRVAGFQQEISDLTTKPAFGNVGKVLADRKLRLATTEKDLAAILQNPEAIQQGLREAQMGIESWQQRLQAGEKELQRFQGSPKATGDVKQFNKRIEGISRDVETSRTGLRTAQSAYNQLVQQSQQMKAPTFKLENINVKNPLGTIGQRLNITPEYMQPFVAQLERAASPNEREGVGSRFIEEAIRKSGLSPSREAYTSLGIRPGTAGQLGLQILEQGKRFQSQQQAFQGLSGQQAIPVSEFQQIDTDTLKRPVVATNGKRYKTVREAEAFGGGVRGVTADFVERNKAGQITRFTQAGPREEDISYFTRLSQSTNPETAAFGKQRLQELQGGVSKTQADIPGAQAFSIVKPTTTITERDQSGNLVTRPLTPEESLQYSRAIPIPNVPRFGTTTTGGGATGISQVIPPETSITGTILPGGKAQPGTPEFAYQLGLDALKTATDLAAERAEEDESSLQGSFDRSLQFLKDLAKVNEDITEVNKEDIDSAEKQALRKAQRMIADRNIPGSTAALEIVQGVQTEFARERSLAAAQARQDNLKIAQTMSTMQDQFQDNVLKIQRSIPDPREQAIAIAKLQQEYGSAIIKLEKEAQANELAAKRFDLEVQKLEFDQRQSAIEQEDKSIERQFNRDLALGKFSIDVANLTLSQQKFLQDQLKVEQELGIPAGGTNNVIIGSELRQGGTAAWRNNNPGNIKFSTADRQVTGFAQQLLNAGVPISEGSLATDGGSFIAFPDLETGEQAMITLLGGSTYRNLTVNQALKRWSGNGYGGEIVPSLSSKKIATLSNQEFDTLVNAMKNKEGFGTGTITDVSDMTRPVTKFERERADELRKEFIALPEVKSFKEVRDSYSRIIAAGKDSTAAGDLALIFNYMKMLDPGSVVREGEFATAANAGGVDDRIRALYNNIARGERLSMNMRRDFIERAGRLYVEQKQGYKTSAQRYGTLAQQVGTQPDLVVADIGLNLKFNQLPRRNRLVDWSQIDITDLSPSALAQLSDIEIAQGYSLLNR